MRFEPDSSLSRFMGGMLLTLKQEFRREFPDAGQIDFLEITPPPTLGAGWGFIFRASGPFLKKDPIQLWAGQWCEEAVTEWEVGGRVKVSLFGCAPVNTTGEIVGLLVEALRLLGKDDGPLRSIQEVHYQIEFNHKTMILQVFDFSEGPVWTGLFRPNLGSAVTERMRRDRLELALGYLLEDVEDASHRQKTHA